VQEVREERSERRKREWLQRDEPWVLLVVRVVRTPTTAREGRYEVEREEGERTTGEEERLGEAGLRRVE